MDSIKSKKQKVVNYNDQKFIKAVETAEHIYFVDENEGDDNGNTLMFDINSLELVSNNYFASQSFIEDIQENKVTKIEKSFEYNYKEILKNNELY